VMEFIPGDNLWEMIKKQGAPFSEVQSIAWIIKICDAVTYLHNQTPPIIHRDIKPQNIKAMPNDQVVLVDFGVAKEGSTGARTATGARGVTPGFSPPEQYSGSGSSPASDVYALGATLYALLTGIKPPDSVSLAIGEVDYVPPDQHNPAICSEIAAAITWAMQPKPVDRPQTVDEWQQRLLAVSEGVEPVSDEEEPESEIKAAPQAADQVVKPQPVPDPVSDELPCPECGSRNRPNVRFCEQCGTSLAAPGMICSSCGVESRPGVRFCEECGEAIE
jgi:eukaryotic-like serine/threonine-protein kinase